MANTISQNITAVQYYAVSTTSAVFSTMSNPSLIVVIFTEDGDAAATTPTISDDKNAGNYTIDSSIVYSSTNAIYIASKQNTQTAGATVTVSIGSTTHGYLKIYEITGAATSSALDVQNTGTASSVPALTLTTTSADDSVFAALLSNVSGGSAADTSYTLDFGNTFAYNVAHAGESRADAGASGAISLSFNMTSRVWAGAVAAYKTATGGASIFLVS